MNQKLIDFFKKREKRKMLKTIYNFFTSNYEKEEKEQNEENTNYQPDYRTGKITYIASNSAEIDHSYVFGIKTDCFKINDKVRYKIKNNYGNIDIYDVVLDYKIKTGPIINIDDKCEIQGGYKFNTKNIDFKPMIGDIINLKIYYDTIEVNVDKKIISGFITSYDYDLKQGFINDVIFYKEDCNFEPCIDIFVKSTVIKHKNGLRSIKMDIVKKDIIDVTKIPFFTLKYGFDQKIEITVSNFSTNYIEINDFSLITNSIDIIEKPEGHIYPNGSIIYVFNCRADSLGGNESILKWRFGHIKIIRTIKYNVEKNQIVLPGIKKFTMPNYINIKMKQYPLPDKILQICSQDSQTSVQELLKLYPYLEDMSNYIDKMHILLFIEESQIVLNMKLLTNNFPLFLNNDNICLEYKQDSLYSHLCVGDYVYVSKPWEEFKFEGKILDMNNKQIFIKLNRLFMEDFRHGALYNVEFVHNRTPMRKRHMAIDIIHKNNLLKRIFPKDEIKEPTNNTVLKWYNDLNQEQKNAVNNILNQKTYHPYVIFGPPGTGKTMTVVEIILQLCQKNTKLMVVAPTNSSIDLICVKLYEHGCRDMVRLSSYSSYKQGNISSCMSDMTFVPSLLDEPINDDVPIITKHHLGKHSITLGTMQCIGTLCSVGFPSGFFTHIIIDEAGQSTEPEIMIPISFLNDKSQLILAGDPNQLGPVVISKTAQELGLKESFLSRIMKLEQYNNDKRLTTKLIRNYRALPQLVDTISSIFYENDLISMLNDTSKEALLLKTIKINNKHINKSMISINIQGSEQQIKESSSYFNNAEVIKIVLLLNELYNVITPDQIGVITPYSLQAKMINKRLESLNVFSPKIGSVEEFQGAERDVIIFSTVRSKRDNKELPKFITDRNKINVALSRAKVLNIIVGNKNYLENDTLWQSIFKHCE